jgi:AraC family transcriptional regulator of adaptative response/methylated-DNA-[protein]-cysteine methyltransferase
MTNQARADPSPVIEDYERIAEAIVFLENHWRRRPSLDVVAKHAGLSKFHFQRLFSR